MALSKIHRGGNYLDKITLAFGGYRDRLLAHTQQARAQSDEKNVEVGGHFSLLRVPTLTANSTGIVCITIPCPTTAFSHGNETEFGFGSRIGYNVAPYLTLEAEGNFFPRDRDLGGGRKAQGLFGAKAGKRLDKAGIFAKARPGFVRLSRGDYRLGTGACVAVFPPPIGCFQPVARTSFAIDLGGVGEFVPFKKHDHPFRRRRHDHSLW